MAFTLVSADIVAKTFHEAFKGTLPQAHLEAVASYIKASSKNAKGEANKSDDAESDYTYYPANGEAKTSDGAGVIFHVNPTDLSYVFHGTALNDDKTFTTGNGDFAGELVTHDSTKLFEETKYFHFVARDTFLQITFQDGISGDIQMLGYFQTYAGVGTLRGHGGGMGIWSKT